MDTFSALLALGPLAIYLVLLGTINLSRRPLVVSGARELAALGLAMSGLVIVGPMQLFMPQQAARQFGGFVWALLITFYVLCLMLAILVSRPRLVVYNISLDELRPVLVEVAARLDHESVWASRALSMPQMRVHLVLDYFAAMHNVALLSTTARQSVSNWQRLEAALRESLRDMPVSARNHGLWMAMCGVMILLVLGLRIAEDPQTIAQGLDRILHP
jgi:hypothetical protein